MERRQRAVDTLIAMTGALAAHVEDAVDLLIADGLLTLPYATWCPPEQREPVTGAEWLA